MVCRCSSPAEHERRAADSAAQSHRYEQESKDTKIRKLEAEILSMTPDPTKYEILEAEPVGDWLVMKVKFPSCTKCEFEGTKILVFAHISPLTALKWREIDPHFRRPPRDAMSAPKPHQAPSPTARFPATKEGWDDALAYARSKVR